MPLDGPFKIGFSVTLREEIEEEEKELKRKGLIAPPLFSTDKQTSFAYFLQTVFSLSLYIHVPSCIAEPPLNVTVCPPSPFRVIFLPLAPTTTPLPPVRRPPSPFPGS